MLLCIMSSTAAQAWISLLRPQDLSLGLDCELRNLEGLFQAGQVPGILKPMNLPLWPSTSAPSKKRALSNLNCYLQPWGLPQGDGKCRHPILNQVYNLNTVIIGLFFQGWDGSQKSLLKSSVVLKYEENHQPVLYRQSTCMEQFLFILK